jgi:hypothetical protein
MTEKCMAIIEWITVYDKEMYGISKITAMKEIITHQRKITQIKLLKKQQ